MLLRVSNMLMTSNMLKYIQDNLQRAVRYQEESSTGKTVLRPSDKPSEISHLMSVNATIARNEQYSRNIEDGLAYLGQSDAALNTVGVMLRDAKVLALQGNNDTVSGADRKAIAVQIDKQIDGMVDLANTSLGGKYIFAGRKNSQPPFCRINDEIYYRGDTGRVTREIVFGASYEVNVAGVKNFSAADGGVFGKLTDPAEPANQIDDPLNPGPPPQKLTRVIGGPLEVLKTLRNSLKNDDAAGISRSVGELDTAFDNAEVHRVGVGARTRHLEAVHEQLADQETGLKGVLVDVQGADVPKLTVEAAQNRMLCMASLMTSSQLLQTSLLNYLK